MIKPRMNSLGRDRRQRLTLSVFSISLFLLLSTNGIGQAQVSTAITQTTGAGNLGTVVTPPSSGNIYAITGGTRPLANGQPGQNLFHSFEQFTVGTGDIARFQTAVNNPVPDLGISNILGRVTGGTPSSIFGTINSATYYPNANLFLLNPAGIVFGLSASLNVGGSVHFTTADYLRLTDGRLFNAMPNSVTDGLLNAAPVAAFGFLGPDAASITVQGSTLQVAEGQTLSLIGGNRTFESATGETVPAGVTIAGGIVSAPSGRVLLASVDSAGEVVLNPPGQVSALNVASFSKLGKVALSEGTQIDVSTLTDADGAPISLNGNGTVQIRAGEFVVDSSSITIQNLGTQAGEPAAVNIAVRPGPGVSGDVKLQNGSAIQVLTYDAPGGDIVIDAHAISLSGISLIQSYAEGTANGGAIAGSASDKISISEFSEIASFAESSGNGGPINLSAKSMDVGMLNPLSGGSISSNASDVGNGGNIALTLQQDLNVRGGGFIGSSGGSAGAAGNITLSAGGTVTLSGLANPGALTNVILTTGGVQASSRPGDINIHSGKFVMERKAQINSGASAQLGANVTVVADESVVMSGGSRIRVGTSDQAGGKVFLNSPTITLDNASVRTRTVGTGDATAIEFDGRTMTFTESQVTASSGGSGRGGNVSLTASDTVSISGQFTDEFGATSPGGIFTDAQGTGAGGNMTVSAQQLVVQNSGALSAKTSGTASSATGGSITVNANQMQLNDGGLVTAESTGSGNAGAITINASGDFQSNSGIVRTTATQAQGGDINITAGQDVLLSNDASVSASSTGAGNAGNITALAGDDFVMQSSSITTQATQASGGNIKIGAADQIVIQNSLISASVMGGSGSGGNISIDPNAVILQNSQILAQAVQGNGGNITIITPLFLADQTSLVSASSQFGLNGTVNIQSPTSNLSGTVSSLPSSMRRSQALQTGRCAALANSQSSSLIIAGRETIPTEPGGWLPSPFAPTGEDAGPFAQTAPQPTPLLAPADEAVSLRRLTPAGFLTQRFAESGSTGCRS